MLVWIALMAERTVETISRPDMVIGRVGSVLVGLMAARIVRNRHVGMFVIRWAGAALPLIGQRSR